MNPSLLFQSMTFQEALRANLRNSGLFPTTKLETLTLEDAMEQAENKDNWIIS